MPYGAERYVGAGPWKGCLEREGVMRMKRFLGLVALAFVTLFAVAQPALAGYPPKPGNHPSVAPKVIHSPGVTRAPSGIAFTGANIAIALLIALALAVVGMALLWGARRLGRNAPTVGGSS